MSLSTLANKYWQIILITVISAAYALFLLSGVIFTIPNRPNGVENMMVGHYYEDYYEYLSFVKQGQGGNILLQNLFTNDDTEKILIPWFVYPLIGLTSFPFKSISIVVFYWLSSFFLMTLFFLLNYFALGMVFPGRNLRQKGMAFLLTILASSFFTIKFVPTFTITPFNFWHFIGSPFARYNIGTPHHQAAELLFLLSLIVMIKVRLRRALVKYGLFYLMSVLLLFFASAQLILFWLVFLTANFLFLLFTREGSDAKASSGQFTGLFVRTVRKTIPYLLLILAVVPIYLMINKYFQQSPTYRSGNAWDRLTAEAWDRQNVSSTMICQFILGSGPVAILGFLGLPLYFSRITFPRLVFFLVAFFSVFLILVPIEIADGVNLLSLFGVHSLRFNTAVSYIFWGSSALMLIKKLSKNTKIFFFLSGAVLLLNLPALSVYLKESLQGPYSASYLQYMPLPMYQGIKSLGEMDKEMTILSSPKSSLGLVIPAIAGKRVYFGRSIFTLDFERKKKQANDFYNLSMGPKDASGFLSQERIDYVVVSIGDLTVEEYLNHYPFLTPKQQSDSFTILAVY